MTRDFLDSLSEKLQAPSLSVPTRDDDTTKIETYWGGHQWKGL